MPAIRIDYDENSVSESDITAVSNAIQKIVANTTGIEDTFVYAQSPKIQIKAAPIEIFVQMSASKIADIDALFAKLQTELSVWKKETDFKHPLNFTLIPMQWKFEINI